MDTPILKTDAAARRGADADLIGGAGADLIKETTTQTFTADVIEASREVPVIVDFWAPWCGPCRQLTPMLEAAVKAAAGAVRMVKMNIDEHPAIAGQLGVQSIPAVFAFHNGQPVDGFMGAVPESQLTSFVERLAKAGKGVEASDHMVVANAALEEGDFATAAQIYATILQEDNQNADALGGLAKCYIKTGDLERGEETLALTPPDKASAGAITAARAMLDLARKSAAAGDLAPLEARVAANGDDFEARLELAIGLNAQGQRAAALDHLMAIIAKDRGWNEDAAHKQLLQFFEAWGPSDPATIKGRQRLSSLLFA